MISAWRSCAAVLFCLVLPVSIGAMNCAAALLSAALLAAVFSGEKSDWREGPTPAAQALAAYCAVAMITSALGVDPHNSVRVLYKDFHKFWILALLLLTLKKMPARAALGALAGGFLLIATVGLYQSAALREGSTWIRAHAFVHPVTYGEQMALAWLGILCLLLKPPQPLPLSLRRSLLAFLTLISAAFVLNQTRGAFLGLAAGFAAIGLAEPRCRRWFRWFLAAAFALAVLWELLPTGRSLITMVRNYGWSPTQNEQLNRLVFWKTAWRMFLDHPWTGVGPGNYRIVFDRYFSGLVGKQHVWGSAHNLYLHQLAERGLLGFAALMGVLGTLTQRAWKRARLNPSALNLWAWGAVAAFLAMNLTEVSFQNEQVVTLLFFIWAWAETRHDHARKTA